MSENGNSKSGGTLVGAVQILCVSDEPVESEWASARAVVHYFEQDGHRVLGVGGIGAGEESLQNAIHASIGAGADVLVLLGHSGVGSGDHIPEHLEQRLTRLLAGFGESVRRLLWDESPGTGMNCRATGGQVGALFVFSLPNDVAVCELALKHVLIPQIKGLLWESARDGASMEGRPRAVGLVGQQAPAAAEMQPASDEELPPPSGSFGQLGQGSASVGLEESGMATEEGPDSAEDTHASGWKRAVYELKATVDFDARVPLPEVLEAFAPARDVVHRAGETATMKLEDGRAYSLWGWPDLRRPTSKVLAIGSGSPLGEVLALHRYPGQTGVCIDGDGGVLPSRDSGVAAICEAVCGKEPADTSGVVFAVSSEAVWIERGKEVIRWDGSRESREGYTKQALGSLVLRWSNR
jgi:molybdopterin biosynthesis enzyme MoaB